MNFVPSTSLSISFFCVHVINHVKLNFKTYKLEMVPTTIFHISVLHDPKSVCPNMQSNLKFIISGSVSFQCRNISVKKSFLCNEN